MVYAILVGLLAVAFFGAGVANAVAAPAQRDSFVRWGYPAWWCRVTGVLEMADAALIALPATRLFGLFLGAAIILAAIVTVVRHRDFGHLVPLGVFVVLIGLLGFLPWGL